MEDAEDTEKREARRNNRRRAGLGLLRNRSVDLQNWFGHPAKQSAPAPREDRPTGRRNWFS